MRDKDKTIIKNRIEPQLKQTELEYLLVKLVESLPYGVIITDFRSKIIYANEATEQSTGHSRNDLIGKSPKIFNASQNAEEVEHEITNCMQYCNKWCGDIPQRRKDGGGFIGEFTVFPVKDEDETIAWGSMNRDVTERKQIEHALRENEEKFRKLFNNTNDAIALHHITEDGFPGRYIEVNDVACQMWGYSREELLAMSPLDIDAKEHIENVPQIMDELLQKKHVTFEIAHLTKYNKKIPVEISSHLFILNGENVVLSIVRDITQRKKSEELLKVQSTAMESSTDGMAILDSEENIIYVNKALAKIYGYANREQLIGQSWKVLYDRQQVQRIERDVKPRVIAKGEWQGEATVKTYDGMELCHDISITLLDEGGFVCVVRDITARKRLENKLKYLSWHDPLTGLYNRVFFEQEMSLNNFQLISLIVCDINGLKLVNDSLGHQFGDKLLVATAKVLKESVGDSCVVARIGGDEFAVLLPNSDEIQVDKISKRIRNAVFEYNTENPKVPLSISVGFATSSGVSAGIMELFKEADDNMYREKLYHSRSARSAIVNTLMQTLEERDYITEGHADRLHDLVIDLAKALKLSEQKRIELRLLAQFHDIGKVGIPDRILFKNGSLTGEEVKEMRRHSEIGYRIAQSAPDLTPIADFILKHHEWWNGKGYPLGIKGEEIPLECRILSIADAYDAMTSDRPYRKAMTQLEAVGELKRYAGIQFDPQLVAQFIKLLLGTGT
ncbi:MAG: PAS domain S-box protein [Firmicutes bacterium]|nr:PAS domain S-box protein [Bacillota bacterium]